MDLTLAVVVGKGDRRPQSQSSQFRVLACQVVEDANSALSDKLLDRSSMTLVSFLLPVGEDQGDEFLLRAIVAQLPQRHQEASSTMDSGGMCSTQ
jgi:hypothetical protein